MTVSMRSPLDSERSTRRHAAACESSSYLGYHLNGIDTRSARYPCRRSSSTSPRTCSSAPPCTNVTCASHTRTLRLLEILVCGVLVKGYSVWGTVQSPSYASPLDEHRG